MTRRKPIPEPSELDRARMRRALEDQGPEPICTHTDNYYCQRCSPLGHRPHLEAILAGKLEAYAPNRTLRLVRMEEMDAYLETRRAKRHPVPQSTAQEVLEQLGVHGKVKNRND